MKSTMPNPFAPASLPATALGRLRVLSSTAGLRVSSLQLGGMSIGQSWSMTTGAQDKTGAMRLLDAYADAGGNFIDTANDYQGGESETWIGEWMASRQNRDAMVIAAKYASNFAKDGQSKNHHGNHKKSLFVSLEASLQKLNTTHVDILYLHWWDWASSVKEVMDALHLLVQERKVLYLGISDTPAWIVSAANEYAMSNGKTPFSIHQRH